LGLAAGIKTMMRTAQEIQDKQMSAQADAQKED
jgi:ATP synthase protein I